MGCRPNLPEGILPSDSRLRFAAVLRGDFGMKSSSIFHENLQFPWQRFNDIDHLSRDRLNTPQMRRMQCEPILQFRKLIPIEIIAENRAAHIRQMDANLMGASGFELEADECASFMCLFNAVMRHGALSAGDDAAFCARAESGNRRVDDAAFFFGNTVGNRQIFTEKSVGMKLCGQQTLCVRVPRHAEQSACALIQPIDGVIIK